MSSVLAKCRRLFGSASGQSSRRIDPKVKAARLARRQFISEAIERTIPERIVRHGPFAGMKYPVEKKDGYTYFPKLLGSYEREVSPLIQEMCRTPYDTIVDIGSADGYYAVGFCMRIPSVHVIAFDKNPRAHASLQALAAENGVSDRITQEALCSPEQLAHMELGGKALIFCDCEGYEKHLFTPAVVAALAPHDVFIETHDLKDIEVTPYLRGAFARTHALTAVTSFDDIQKVNLYDFPELQGYSRAERRILLGERRGAIMEWFLFRSRSASPGPLA